MGYRNFILNMSIHNDIVLGLCGLLLCFLVWKEVRRVRRAWLPARLLATVLATGSLAGLGLSWLEGTRPPVAALSKEKEKAAGILSVDWPREIMEGQRLRVQGRVMEMGRVVLMGLGGVLDSAKTDSLFELSTVPAHRGRAVYRLALVNGNDTIDKMDIPVLVDTAPRLRVLVLASAPGPENTFLISWLAQKGYGVASRVAVSRGRYANSFANMAERSLSELTIPLLSAFDLVITDSMPAILQQATEKGLGVIIRVDSASQRQPAGLSLHGMGRQLVLFQDTSFSWVLSGRQSDYSEYWAGLLQRAAGRQPVDEKWSWSPRCPSVGEPMVLILQKAGAQIPQGFVETADGLQTSCYLAEDMTLPFIWRGSYWPRASGWHTVHTSGGDTTWWYVWPQKSHRAVASKVGGMREAGMGGSVWLFAVFLLSVIFLWIEKSRLVI